MDQSPKQVNNQPNTNQPAPPYAQPPKNKSTGLIIGLIIASIVVILGIVAAVFFVLNQNKTDQNAPLQTEEKKKDNDGNKKANNNKKTSSCLEKTDLVSIMGDNDFSMDDIYFKSLYIWFKADSDTTTEPLSQVYGLDDLAIWADSKHDKKFLLRITPSVNETTLSEGGKTLGLKRAEIIKKHLISKGAPADKIIIDDVSNWTSSEGGDAARNVQVYLVNDPVCSK